MMHNVLIRPAVMSERQALEALQRRAALHNPGDGDALLANPDAIELPPLKSPLGACSSRSGTRRSFTGRAVSRCSE